MMLQNNYIYAKITLYRFTEYKQLPEERFMKKIFYFISHFFLITSIFIFAFITPSNHCTAEADTGTIININSASKFQTTISGSTYTFISKKHKINKIKSANSSIIKVKSNNKIKAIKTGKTIVTVTTPKKAFKFTIWVRPATQYNQTTQRVVFVGNSQLRTGNQTDYLKCISKLYGQPVKIINENIDGYTLHDHLNNVQKNTSITKSLKNADVIIFQEYGTRYDTTISDIKEMIKYSNKNARIFYYTTEYDHFDEKLWTENKESLLKLGVKIMDLGQTLEILYNNGFSYEDLHMSLDSHPNSLNGYFGALVMYTMAFDEKCTDYPTKQYLDFFEDIIPGKNRNTKWKTFEKICREIDRLNSTNK